MNYDPDCATELSKIVNEMRKQTELMKERNELLDAHLEELTKQNEIMKNELELMKRYVK